MTSLRRTMLPGSLAACLCAAAAPAQAPCTGDLNADRVVDGNDLGILLGAWGVCSGCVADSNRDGFVDGADLGLLLNGWGTCSVVTPSWATLVEAVPDPAVVTDPVLRQRIIDTGLAWRVRDTATQIEMLLVPPGTFQMGCGPNGGGCDPDELPVHAVTLTNPFYAGRYEVTQAQWQSRMGSNPSAYQASSFEVPLAQVPNRPVERVSWNALHGFLAATNMRLLTEAEWEYACRAGTQAAFHGWPASPSGTSDWSQVEAIAWLSASTNVTRPVGGKSPNGLGLHDTLGNVWEWVSDWYSNSHYASGAATNPSGPGSGEVRILRGGGFTSAPDGNQARCSNREPAWPTTEQSNIGFRVARNP